MTSTAAESQTRRDANPSWAAESSKLWRERHPEEARAAQKRWRDANPEHLRAKARRNSLKALYGMDVDDYERMLVEQGGVCASCGRPETVRNARGDIRPLAVDHDHETRAVRGLLCQLCNQGIGCFRDDPTRLQQAIAYLTRPRP